VEHSGTVALWRSDTLARWHCCVKAREHRLVLPDAFPCSLAPLLSHSDSFMRPFYSLLVARVADEPALLGSTQMCANQPRELKHIDLRFTKYRLQ